MPRGKNQKFKLSYLMKVMMEKTDEDHYIRDGQSTGMICGMVEHSII